MTPTKRRNRLVFNYFIITFCRIKKRVWIHDGVVRRFAPLLMCTYLLFLLLISLFSCNFNLSVFI